MLTWTVDTCVDAFLRQASVNLVQIFFFRHVWKFKLEN